MNPSSSLRIHTMMRALQETIIPAVHEDQPLAKEQASLLLGHLAALQAQGSREGLVDDRSHILLLELCDELAQLSDSESGLSDLRGKLIDAREQEAWTEAGFLCERLLAVSEVSEAFKQASFRCLSNYTKAHIQLGRVWFAPMGFDSSPGDLPDMDALLSS